MHPGGGKHGGGGYVQSPRRDPQWPIAGRGVQLASDPASRLQAQACRLCLIDFKDDAQPLPALGISPLDHILDRGPRNDVRADPAIAESSIVKDDEFIAGTKQETITPDEKDDATQGNSAIPDSPEAGRHLGRAYRERRSGRRTTRLNCKGEWAAWLSASSARRSVAMASWQSRSQRLRSLCDGAGTRAAAPAPVRWSQ
jgi:hypothetical protein